MEIKQKELKKFEINLSEDLITIIKEASENYIGQLDDVKFNDCDGFRDLPENIRTEKDNIIKFNKLIESISSYFTKIYDKCDIKAKEYSPNNEAIYKKMRTRYINATSVYAFPDEVEPVLAALKFWIDWKRYEINEDDPLEINEWNRQGNLASELIKSISEFLGIKEQEVKYDEKINNDVSDDDLPF